MANITTIEKMLVKIGGVFPNTKIGPDGMETYSELLKDIPDEVIIQTMKNCLMHCRYFPTIAEIRERAIPFIQEWNLKNQKLLENNVSSKCKKNAWWENEITPMCRIEEEKGKCEFMNTGACCKWDVEYRNKTREDVYGKETE